MKVMLAPIFRGEDKGDGGIRRVVEAQQKYLPQFDWDIVGSEEEADVVALHAGVWVPTNKPVVLHCHGLYWSEQQHAQWEHKLNRQVADNIVRADLVTVPSQWVANAVSQAFWVEPTIIGHGIDFKEWQPGNSEGYVLWNKNRQDEVCTPYEVQQLAEMAPDIKFLSTFGEATQNLAITGRQPFDVMKVTVSNASVYLATSKETFGIGALEAMACGVPVLGWNWGGVADVVQHGINGYLARPGDFADLLNGLRFCLSERDTISKSNLYDIKMFDWQYVIQGYTSIYQEALHYQNRGRVSVIIPCYNLGRFLTEAVDSVANEADEIIIVDDASIDDTRQVINVLREKYNQVDAIHNETNRHVSASRNAGVEIATGDYILTLDPDDRMAPGAISLLRDALDKDRDIDIAYGAVQFTDEDGNPLEQVGNNGVSGWPPAFNYRGTRTYPISYCPIASMFRKKVWKRTLGYRSRYKGVEDADFWTRAVSIGFKPAKVTDAITLIYRVRRDSLSHTEKKIDWTIWYPEQVAIPPVGPINISMHDPILISVVIPVGPQHSMRIIDALDSLWAQTLHRWEAIVVNDTGIDLLLPSWVKEVDVGASEGPSIARNHGINKSKGRFIYFLDADDYLQPQALEKLYEAIKDQRGVYVYGDWYDETGKIHETPDCVGDDTRFRLPIPNNILIRKEDAPLYDESIEAWEDWDYSLQIAERGLQGRRVPIALFSYRMHTGQRREAMASHKEELKQVIYNKWKKYIEGEEQLACGACQKARMIMQSQTVMPPMSVGADNRVLVKYNGASLGTRTFPGRVTGTMYRFGNTPDHRVKSVFKEDVQGLLEIKDFELYKEEVQQLVAAN